MDDTPTKQDQNDLDEALEDTFPASDPPANSGTTGPGDTSGEVGAVGGAPAVTPGEANDI